MGDFFNFKKYGSMKNSGGAIEKQRSEFYI